MATPAASCFCHASSPLIGGMSGGQGRVQGFPRQLPLVWPPRGDVVPGDPLRGLLDGAPIASFAQAHGAASAAGLRVTDTHHLMACVCNGELPAAVRCGALQQLQALVPALQHVAAIAVPSFLEECLVHAEAAVGVVGAAVRDSGVATPQNQSPAGGGSPKAPLSIFQMQLPVAALNLLGALCTCSAGVLVRPWSLPLSLRWHMRAAQTLLVVRVLCMIRPAALACYLPRPVPRMQGSHAAARAPSTCVGACRGGRWATHTAASSCSCRLSSTP